MHANYVAYATDRILVTSLLKEQHHNYSTLTTAMPVADRSQRPALQSAESLLVVGASTAVTLARRAGGGEGLAERPRRRSPVDGAASPVAAGSASGARGGRRRRGRRSFAVSLSSSMPMGALAPPSASADDVSTSRCRRSYHDEVRSVVARMRLLV